MQRLNAKIQPSHANGSLVQSPDLPITQWGEKLLVDARLLHRKLESKQDFSTWIKERIEDFGFEETNDYSIKLWNQKRKGNGGDRRSIDYLLTLDTAKELAMLERNEIGRMIRRYFIQKEKESRGEILALPKDDKVFAKLQTLNINGRTLYPFCQFVRSIGGKTPGSSYVKRYPNHFVEFDDLRYVSEELALQIYFNKRIRAARLANSAMQPILPYDFADRKELKGGSHE